MTFFKTDAPPHVVAREIGPKLAAQVVRGHRLARGADIVALALDASRIVSPRCV
jgi:hypothetical protein